MSNGEVLAAANKFITKNLEPHNFPKFCRLLRMFLIHSFGIQRLSWIKKEQGEGMQGLGADSKKQRDLGSLRKVQLRIERIYDQKFLRATTGLDTEKILFNTYFNYS
jgi:hypothetical protein